jgi:hypothetical protein
MTEELFHSQQFVVSLEGKTIFLFNRFSTLVTLLHQLNLQNSLPVLTVDLMTEELFHSQQFVINLEGKTVFTFNRNCNLVTFFRLVETAKQFQSINSC